jgi:hypothetical protein
MNLAATNPWELIADLIHDFNEDNNLEHNCKPEIDDLVKAKDEE